MSSYRCRDVSGLVVLMSANIGEREHRPRIYEQALVKGIADSSRVSKHTCVSDVFDVFLVRKRA